MSDYIKQHLFAMTQPVDDTTAQDETETETTTTPVRAQIAPVSAQIAAVLAETRQNSGATQQFCRVQ